MNSESKKIQAVPTNVVTGFLGVGKTSAILHLLKNKPAGERWAVLVNEFGEIGVDGSLFSGQHSEDDGVFIREVPGGCMCCAAGIPMQTALNQLLKRAQPDRVLIEPTGLGHPREVLEVLSSSFNQEALSLQKTLALVDARNLSDKRYTTHDTFNQQIAIADVVVGNKLDLYREGDQDKLKAYVKKHGRSHAKVIFTEQGEISLSCLTGTMTTHSASPHHHEHREPELLSDAVIPDSGFIRAVNEGEGFVSVGWRFGSDKVFNRINLFAVLSGIAAERMKAVFKTDSGVYGYNLAADALTEFELSDGEESRIEIISNSSHELLEKELLGCLVN